MKLNAIAHNTRAIGANVSTETELSFNVSRINVDSHKITQQEAEEAFIRLLTHYTVPPCVGAAAPGFANVFDRIDGDMYKKYAFIASDWYIKRTGKMSALYVGQTVKDEKTALALSELFKAHTSLLKLLCGVWFDDLPREASGQALANHNNAQNFDDYIKHIFENYGLALRTCGLTRSPFYIEFISTVPPFVL